MKRELRFLHIPVKNSQGGNLIRAGHYRITPTLDTAGLPVSATAIEEPKPYHNVVTLVDGQPVATELRLKKDITHIARDMKDVTAAYLHPDDETQPV